MDKLFRTLTHFAIDPFERQTALRNPRHALAGEGLSDPEIEVALGAAPYDTREVANGDFESCETCIDPGDDPDPFPMLELR